jgi:hypothetical protein
MLHMWLVLKLYLQVTYPSAVSYIKAQDKHCIKWQENSNMGDLL